MKTHEIHDLLEEKLDAFRDFLSATVALKDVPGSDNDSDMDKIQLLVDKRQNCITMIDSIDNRINSLSAERKALILTLHPEEKEKIKKTVKTIADIASRAVSLNLEFQSIFQFRYGRSRNRLIRLGHTRNGIQGYARSEHRTHDPRFLNVRS